MRLYPRIDPTAVETRSERDVLKALLATLDDTWSCYYSYNWLRRERFLEASEIDLILVHPRYGMLVLEVKGGDVSYDPATRDWWQNGEPMKDPFAQALTGTHALRKQIAERARFIKGGEFPCTFGYGVVFPDRDYQGTLPPGAHGSVLYGARDLPELGKRVQDTLRSWARDQRPVDMLPHDVEELRKALQSTFRLVASLSRDMDKDEELLVQLTQDQSEVLEGLYANARVRIEGTAGSGKTMLALERAKAYANEGLSALLLCYNRKLADWLRQRAPVLDGLKIAHFHGICAEFCDKAGLEWAPPEKDSEHFWRHRTVELLLDATDIATDRYDAIVVDEGQDFHDEWWLGIESLLREPGGPLYIFYDRAQNLFGTGMRFPEGFSFALRENCRNTRAIARSCGQVIGFPIRSPRHCPDGVEPELRGFADDSELRQSCTALLRELSLPASRIALLSPYKPANSRLRTEPLGRYALLEDVEAWMAGKGVWFSSIRAFKGLEAEVMILVDVGDFREGKFERQDLFVACSRARHRLFVYTNSEQIRQLMGR